MRPDELERRLQARLDALGPVPRAELLHVLMLPDFDRANAGPFVDRSGGLIIFDGDSREDAERLVARDPFIREDLLQQHWVKEWAPEQLDA